jgi:hypothetical protein
MKHMLLLRSAPGTGPQEGTPEFDAETKAWGALNEELKKAGVLVSAMRLELDDAETTRRAPKGERILTDGPFAPTLPASSSLRATPIPRRFHQRTSDSGH